ncbi:MAG TPA: hemerythrin domain-containing protein [Allosphingosinicella sp.]|nr:hemerythrin domain-containing protein [Allosphingosinicella sp.]
MATKTVSKQSSRSRSSGGNNRGGATRRDSDGRFTSERSAFSWGGGNAGVLAGAAIAGAAVGIAANFGRKFLMQMPSAAAGDWFEALKAEHKATLAVFDQIEATGDSQTTLRTALLMKLKYALTKHAHEEETIIYPALRQANSVHDADALNAEHGYVKTYLYELENLAKDGPGWLARVRDFRAMLEEHIRMEEDEVFPAFKQVLSEEQNARLTSAMNREGFKMA